MPKRPGCPASSVWIPQDGGRVFSDRCEFNTFPVMLKHTSFTYYTFNNNLNKITNRSGCLASVIYSVL